MPKFSHPEKKPPRRLTPEAALRLVTCERNRYRHALRKISRGEIIHNGHVVELSAHCCKLLACQALAVRSRVRNLKH